MATRSAVMSIRIVGDGKEAQASFKQTESAAADFSGTMDRVASSAAFGRIADGIKEITTASIDAASEAEQNMGAVETVFGSAADAIEASASSAANAVGMSASSYEGLAATIGGSLKSAVSSQDELASKTEELISAGADLSSVFGGSTADAVEAMGAALRGEYDSLESYGVFLSAAAVNAEVAAEGNDKLTGSALTAAQKVATQNLIMQQAADYSGNFADEADTAAGAQQRATAAWDDAKAALGGALLPAIVIASNALSSLAGFIEENSSVVMPLVLMVGALAVAIQGYNMVMAALPALQAASTGAQWLWNAAMTANPVGLFVAAIVVLIAIVVLLWNKVAWFRDGVTTAFEWIVTAGQKVGAWFVSLPGTIGSAFSNAGSILINAGKNIIGGFLNGLKAAWSSVTSFISGIGPWIAANKGPVSYDRTLLVPAGAAIMDGFNESLSAGMKETKSIVGNVNGLVGGIGDVSPTASITGAGTAAGGTGSGTVINITVNGALDAVSVGEQIRNILATYDRSQGTITAGAGGAVY